MQTGDRPDYGKRKKGGTAQAKKGRVRTFDTIKHAVSQGHYGQIFTTKGANRIYVMSKGKWGSKSGRGKIAKGFTPGSATPSAKWSSVKKYAARTLVRHGSGSKKTLGQKYLPKGAQEKKK